MVSPAREYSLEQHLLECVKFSRIQKENLTDLVHIVTSLKNKYSIVPFVVAVQGEPVRNALAARYLMDTLLRNQLMEPAARHASPAQRAIERIKLALDLRHQQAPPALLQ